MDHYFCEKGRRLAVALRNIKLMFGVDMLARAPLKDDF